jgi:hypothetical protein
MNSNTKWMKVLALAMGLPSIIIGLFFALYGLVQKEIISWGMALIILLVVIVNTLYLMVRYGVVQKNKQ